jgi:hypothetical protein
MNPGGMVESHPDLGSHPVATSLFSNHAEQRTRLWSWV